MPMSMPSRALLLGAVLTVATLPRPAAALDEGEWQVGLTGNLVINTNGEQAHPGGGLRLDGRYGLTDALSAWGALGTVIGGGPRHATGASAGLGLAFDVLRWVPLVEVGVIALQTGGIGPSARYLGADLGAGAEFLIDPRWSIAGMLRFQAFPIQLTADASDPGVLITIGLRLARTF